jgi:MFS family permease
MGAAIAALKRVFLDGTEESRNLLQQQPVCTVLAVGICLILTFSAPIQKYKKRYGWLRILAGLGLLPGFFVAAVVGPFVGEIVYEFEWGFRIPPFGELFQSVSPFSIGWPSWGMFFDPGIIALALMGYVILFGDLVTGIEVLKAAVGDRPDEKISIDVNRAHLSIAIRNAIMAIFAPFFPSQGCLWTGVHVIVVQRWREGRGAVDSLFSGISSYYIFGIPVLYAITPLVVGLKPLFGIALSLTLVLTGFACSYVAMALPKTPIERGVVLLTGTTLAVFSPWVGLTVGIVATLTLVGVDREAQGSQG